MVICSEKINKESSEEDLIEKVSKKMRRAQEIGDSFPTVHLAEKKPDMFWKLKDKRSPIAH